MKHFARTILLGALATALLVPQLYAGNTGKIVGKVTDRGTGEPLFGVNILVVGTTRGATTDPDGKFSIIGVPIGSYVVRASAIGYTISEAKGVSIGADETTPLNFQMLSSEVQVEGVTITADQALVNVQATTGTQTVSKEAIESIPNVKNVEDVLKLQAGVVKQGNNLFLRGGRANEVQYLVDGMPTNSIVGNTGDLVTTSQVNSELAALYTGQSTGVIGGGSSGLAVSANAIQSVSVQTSGFDADYGNAQSGIINITTKSGGDRFTGSAQYRTDKIASTNQNEWYTSFSFGGPEPISKYVLPGLGVDLPGDLSFFISADVSQADGAYTFVHNQFYNPLDRRVEVSGLLGGLMNGLGFNYTENQNNGFTFNTKLRYDISGEDQVSYGYRASLSSGHGYNKSYKFRADSSTLGSGYSVQNNLGWTHFFTGGKSFLKFYLAELQTKDGNDIAGAPPPSYSSAYENLDVNADNFIDVSTGQRWYNSESSIWSTRFDFNSQVHELHLLKTGFELNFEEIKSTEIVRPTAPLPDSTGAVVNAPYPGKVNTDHGDYPGYGQYRAYMNNLPNRGGIFLQDNIEFSGLNLHVGVRYDWFDIGRQVFDPDYVSRWEAATQMTAQWAEREVTSTGELGDYKRLKGGSSFLYYATHGNFSPRLSIGYPVTDRIVFYFNYGHFLQLPDRENYFRNPFDRTLSNLTLVGNPDLKPQRTVQYEAGFKDQFSDDMAFGIHAFYKDIFDYVTGVNLTDIVVPINFDYASSRGFELTFNQAFAGNFSMNLSYSYQIAKGRSSNPFASVFNPQFQLPRETRLNWDQNHTANVFASYRVGPNEEGKLFGLPFVNNYGISLTWSLGSGFPYTPYISRTTQANLFLVNTETNPYTSTIDLSIYKGFRFAGSLNVIATLDVTNLLNRRNVTSVLNYTGKSPVYGDLNPSDPSANIVNPWNKTEFDFLDETWFGPPRQILLGVRLNWD
jgi:outer membrane receptor protein involved in Fe transport